MKKTPPPSAIRRVADTLAEFLRPLDHLSTNQPDIIPLKAGYQKPRPLPPSPTGPPQIALASGRAWITGRELDKEIRSLGNEFTGWGPLMLVHVLDLSDVFARIVKRFGW